MLKPNSTSNGLQSIVVVRCVIDTCNPSGIWSAGVRKWASCE
jgi:hypothetical protein